MRPNPARSRLARILVMIAVLAVIREISIRRHQGELEEWPRSA